MRKVALALAFGLSLAPAARADNVPGIGWWDYNFLSLDPSPLRIEFTSGPFSIPRKYVVVAGGYSSRNGPLPDIVKIDRIRIAFVDQDGEAWSVALTERTRRTGRPAATIVREMRPQLYSVDLHSINNPNRRIDIQASLASGVRQPELYDGMLHYKNGSDVYVGGPSDSFESIRCDYTSHALSYCTYSVEITDGIWARVDFLDFRLHGGRSYANRRARFVREVVCRFAVGCRTEIAGNGAGSIPFIADQKRRVCIARDGPQKEVVMGLTPKIQSSLPNVKKDAQWIERVESLAWRMRVPETPWQETQEAWLRSGVSRTFHHHLLYPEMVPSGPIHEELRAAWSTASRDGKPLPVCTAYAEISFEELAARRLFMEVIAPAQYPEIADRAPTLDCGPTVDTQSPRPCVLRFQRDGWRVSLMFRSQFASEANAIREKAGAYLDRITLSRDPVPTISTDKK